MTSGNTLEPSFISTQYRFVPPFGDAVLEPICGQTYMDWYKSKGAKGTEPPADIKTLFDLTSQFQSSIPGTDQYKKIGQEIGDIHMNNMWLIGVIGPSPSVLIHTNRLGNFPKVPMTAWEYYRMYPYHPAQWYIKE
jgi:peptide/nickel transport system substrate-binding protein